MTYEVGDVIREESWVEGEFITYEVQEWMIADILSTVTESADFPEFDGTPSMWAYLIASKGGDFHTPELIERIAAEGFLYPICIYRSNLGAYGLGNGHHRFVAALLLGMDSIQVFMSDTPEEYYPNASDGGEDLEDAGYSDEASADMIFKSFSKIHKKLKKAEDKALAEEEKMR